jgi:hypothetical protein
MNPLTQSKNTTIVPVLMALILAGFALSPLARAVCQDECRDLDHGASTFQGEDALINNTAGANDTAFGFLALTANTSGSDNTAVGGLALTSNIVGAGNTAVGYAALAGNTFGFGSTAVGNFALWLNNGGNNTATGASALQNNTDGTQNTAVGKDALTNNTLGNNNTAVGNSALGKNKTGQSNIALGAQAGQNLTGNNNIDIGNKGVQGEAGTIRIGATGTQANTYVAGISGVTLPTGVGVIVDTNGHLGTTTSSARFKDQIKPMDKASEAILSLRPVSFRYKKQLDPDGIPQFGLVAEEVAKVNPDLVARDANGKAYTVRYEAVNAMLLNEFLKEHRKVEGQQATIAEVKSTAAEQATTIARQQKEIEVLAASLKAQAAQIQKVSDRLNTQAPAPRVVAND